MRSVKRLSISWPSTLRRPVSNPRIESVEYQHIIEVNDATVPDPLTRNQLWQGLMLRAERPDWFVGGLDHYRILERHEMRLERELQIGETVVRDRVLLNPDNELRFEVWGQTQLSGDSLAMAIEEPDPGELFVRFSYQVQLGEQIVEDSPEADALKGAYYRVDRDTILMAQRYARTGRLD